MAEPSNPSPEQVITKENLFVITGGPGAGKTTIIQELQRRNFVTVPEIARQIIQEQVLTNGNALPWADTGTYTELMLSRSIDSFLALDSCCVPAFCDRGIPDTLCYARIIKYPGIRTVELACQQFRYNRRVFLLAPWKKIYKTDTERKQTFAEAIQVYQQMKRVYAECDYQVCEVPIGPVSARTDFILRLAETP